MFTAVQNSLLVDIFRWFAVHPVGGLRHHPVTTSSICWRLRHRMGWCGSETVFAFRYPIHPQLSLALWVVVRHTLSLSLSLSRGRVFVLWNYSAQTFFEPILKNIFLTILVQFEKFQFEFLFALIKLKPRRRWLIARFISDSCQPVILAGLGRLVGGKVIKFI